MNNFDEQTCSTLSEQRNNHRYKNKSHQTGLIHNVETGKIHLPV
jgi:hypothetical protein